MATSHDNPVATVRHARRPGNRTRHAARISAKTDRQPHPATTAGRHPRPKTTGARTPLRVRTPEIALLACSPTVRDLLYRPELPGPS